MIQKPIVLTRRQGKFYNARALRVYRILKYKEKILNWQILSELSIGVQAY
jgi:hypothetical protein